MPCRTPPVRFRLLFSRVCALIALGAALGADAPPGAEKGVITTLGEFYGLPAEQFGSGRPFRIQAVVAYYDAEWKMLYAQDATALSYVEVPKPQPGLEAGDLILLEGVGVLTNGTRRFAVHGLHTRGRSKLPPAVPAGAADLLSGPGGDLYVIVRGEVRSIYEDDRLHLSLLIDQRRVPVLVRKYLPADLTGLLDAKVRIHAVCARTYDLQGRVQGANLYVSSFANIHLEEPGLADPFGLPAAPIRQLFAAPGSGGETRRVRVRGTVEQQAPGEFLIVSDQTGSVRALTQFSLRLAANQRVDVIGFPKRTPNGPMLGDAMVRVIEAPKKDPPAPAAVTQPGGSLAVLERIQDVARLTSDQARQRYPVKLRAVVSFVDAGWQNLFVHDDTGGLFVELMDQKAALKPGQLVEVTGVTDPGSFLPMIVKSRVAPLGMGSLPAPVQLSFKQGMTGAYDCRWVEVQGVVRSLEVQEDHLFLDLAAQDGHFRCSMPQAPAAPRLTNLVDAVVRVRGVCAVRLNDAKQFVGLEVRIPDETHLRVLEPSAPDAFALPTRPVSEVLRFISPEAATRRVRVRGVVTMAQPGQGLFLQDPTGAIYVQSYQANESQVGDEVEAAGFRALGDYTPILQEAVVRRVGAGVPPAPKRRTAEQLLSGEDNAALVQVEGRLLESVQDSLTPELTVQDGALVFNASLDTPPGRQALSALPAGSRLRLTGVCSIRVGESRQPKAFRLLLRSAADVVVLQRPPWWTVKRILALTGVVVVVALAALGWVVALHRRVRRQTDLIRQRLEREAALEARYQRLVENANDIIFTHNLDGRLLALNHAGARLLGYTQAEAVQMTVAQLVAPEHQDRLRGLYGESQTDGRLNAYELEVVTKTGARRTLELSTRLVLEQDTVTGLETIARDVTDRKRAEEQLRRSEAQLAEAQRIGQVGSWEIDMPANVLSLSAEARRIFGLSTEGILPRESLLSRVHPGDREMVEGAVTRALGREAPFNLDHRIVLPDGSERWIHGQAEVLFDAAGQPQRVLGTVQDITDRQELEIRLRQAQKMESIGQLAAGVAHDFNNILTVIQGHASLLLGDGKLPAPTAESLVEIETSARRAAELTRQLLAFSRRQRMQARVLDLNHLLEEVVKMLGRLLGEHIRLEVRAEPALPTVRADPSLVEQVIINLAVNARDAMPNGGQLRLSTRQCVVNEREARQCPDARPGAFVCLRVEDSGCGMSAAALTHLFEPFFTTKEVGKGTGLGLATVYGIVKQHGGWLTVASTLGKGTTFEIFLPPESAPAQPASPKSTNSKVPAVTQTLLVVEDELAVRTLAVRVLKRQGYRILQAVNGQDALSVWAENGRSIDLLLTDMVMPDGLSGGQLAQRLCEQRPELKVVYSSGYSPELAGEGLDLEEGRNFLQKPYLPDKLVETVRACLESVPVNGAAR